MAIQFRVLCVLLLFICSSEAASRRGCKREGLAALQGQLHTLQQAQEEVWARLEQVERGVSQLVPLLESLLPEDCWMARSRGSRSRVLKVKPPGMRSREVVCDQGSEGGGWTEVLARYPTTRNLTARQDFNRTWAEYKEGFGDLHGEFWIGNEVLHSLTSQAPHQLYVFLEKWNGETGKGFWNYFKVGSEEEQYRLSVEQYQDSISNIGDSFHRHHYHAFSTHDRDNDINHTEHCARRYGGGWWYFRCHASHLTGIALVPGEEGSHAISWRSWGHNLGLKAAYMRIRPLPPYVNAAAAAATTTCTASNDSTKP